jgi:hypothetical protein
MPWSFLKSRSDNIRYPLILALPVVGLSPFPRSLRVAQLLTAYSSLSVIADCPGHYSLHIGYYGDSVAIQGRVSSRTLVQASPRFQIGRGALRLGSLCALDHHSSVVAQGG